MQICIEISAVKRKLSFYGGLIKCTRSNRFAL